MRALRILVVEDDALIGMLLGEMLQAMGYEVCAIVDSEADAVAAAFRYRPDLMIIDAWLKDGSGLTAIETIGRLQSVPHVFASGNIARIKALRPGAVVLQKPFREAELAQSIQRALDAAGPF